MEISLTKLHQRSVSCESIQEELYGYIIENTDILEYYTPVINGNCINFHNYYSRIEFSKNSYFTRTILYIDNRDELYFIKFILSMFSKIFEIINNPSLFNIQICILNDYNLSNIKIPFTNEKVFVQSCKVDGIKNIFKEMEKIC